MKVYELIDKLKKYDPSADVKVENNDITFLGYGKSEKCTCRDCEEVYFGFINKGEEI